jgi:hypothetical protein
VLNFKQDNADAVMIVTLTERTTLTNPDYYFVFTHVATKDVVTMTLSDESLFPLRYNSFTIDATQFQLGEWHYKVFEQDETGVLLEQGKLIIDPAEAFGFTKFDTTNSYKTYNG